MKRDHLAFLLGGLAFGILIGFGIFRTIATRPSLDAQGGAGEIPTVAGPGAPTDVAGAASGTPMGGAGGGAPMAAEINALKERVQKAPGDTDAWKRLGNLYQDAGMFQPAIGFYERVIALKPGDAGVLTDMGICYQQQEQLDKALELFERAQKADPGNWQAIYNTVVVAGLGLGRFDRADAAMARLQQVKPDAPRIDELKSSLDRARAAGSGTK